jgi:hypothetical protein
MKVMLLDPTPESYLLRINTVANKSIPDARNYEMGLPLAKLTSGPKNDSTRMLVELEKNRRVRFCSSLCFYKT